MKKLEKFAVLISILMSITIIETNDCLIAAEQPIQLQALNSMQRVQPYSAVKGKNIAEIKAAGNEYEAFQVAIIAGADNLENVRIKMSDLRGKNGRIGKDNIFLYREEYVPIRHSSPRAGCPPGLYPDPLLPLKNPVTGDPIQALRLERGQDGSHYVGAKYSAYPIDIFAGQNKVIWADVYVPKNTPAGIYNGKFKAVADGNISAEIPVKLTVWNFTLPDTATHRTHLGNFSRIAQAWGIDSGSEKYRQIELRFCKELARHRVNPPIPRSLLPEVNDDGSLTIIPERHEKLKRYIEETHLLDFEVPRAKFMTSTSNSPLATPANQTDPLAIEKTKRYYREFYDYLKKNGWEKRAYLYMLDEPNSVKDYKQVINLGQVVRQAAPELKCLVVEQTYKHKSYWPNIDPYVDIWCPLFSFIDRKTIQQKIESGDQVWSYTALVQPAPNYYPQYKKVKGKNPPYWHIDQPTIAYRIPLWINKQYGITGLLYWTTVQWKDDPFADHPSMGPYSVEYFNGGGMLFYPGKEAGFDGPVTSIRLKNLREGLEDYEYFAILEKKGQQAFVKEIVDSICSEWWNFTTDSKVLLKARERLAAKIVALGE
ncbi:MAG: DUF4091 domain-containing protein [Calditrichaeota bacterium]|nr:DUF4091 domain-containing protein [Calditrichota bacterium]